MTIDPTALAIRLLSTGKTYDNLWWKLGFCPDGRETFTLVIVVDGDKCEIVSHTSYEEEEMDTAVDYAHERLPELWKIALSDPVSILAIATGGAWPTVEVP